LNKPHPNERQLQQYLNSACSELESRRIKRHVYECLSCRTRLHTYLNMEILLDDMPLLMPSSDLEERIMRSIRSEPAGSGDSPIPLTARRASAAGRWSPELINGLIATAATYLFISSGVLNKIMTINAAQWGEDIHDSVEMIGFVVHRLSVEFFS
jgi:hypothetical protein